MLRILGAFLGNTSAFKGELRSRRYSVTAPGIAARTAGSVSQDLQLVMGPPHTGQWESTQGVPLLRGKRSPQHGQKHEPPASGTDREKLSWWPWLAIVWGHERGCAIGHPSCSKHPRLHPAVCGGKVGDCAGHTEMNAPLLIKGASFSRGRVSVGTYFVSPWSWARRS